MTPSTAKWCYFHPLGDSNALYLGEFRGDDHFEKRKQQAKTKDTDHSFYVIYDFQTTMVYFSDAAVCTSHRSKVKKLHSYFFKVDVTWVKWPKELS